MSASRLRRLRAARRAVPPAAPVAAALVATAGPRLGRTAGDGRHRAVRCVVDHTPVFSLRENAIAKEPGASYPERRRCVSRLGASMVVYAPPEPSPNHTLSRGAFSAPSLVTPAR